MITDVTLMAAGYCTQSEHILFRSGPRKTVRFPAIFALLEHTELGPILFDTGYSSRFLDETSTFPYRMYRWATPVYVQDSETAVHSLARRGISARDVKNVILSHFHADHIGGVKDFPDAKFIYSRSCFEAVRSRRGLRALTAGFLPGLLPPDFAERSIFMEDMPTQILPDTCAPFWQAFDILGDSSVLAVPLPGHATAQIGAFVRSRAGIEYFLVADACWHSRAFRERLLPHWITRFIFGSWRDYRTTLDQVHRLYVNCEQMQIIPAHCTETYERYIAQRARTDPVSTTLAESCSP